MNPDSELGMLCVEGVDAKKFLQGQLTCNLDEISPTQYGAQCNPQGRIIHFFRIFYYQDRYYLQMPASMVAIALAALKKYAVFFKVSLSPSDDVIPDCNPHDFQQNIPAIYPETSEKFLPHDLQLPELNAVSFNKGCYTGQEIIARMQYRGKIKNRLWHLKVNTPLVPQRGADIYSQTNIAGILVDYYKTGYNSYELQITATEDDGLFLDPDRKFALTR